MIQGLEFGGVFALLVKWLGYAVLFGLALFFYRMYQVRMLFRRAQREHGVPMAPHSFFLGHLLVVAKLHMKRKIPRDLHGHWTFSLLQEEFPEISKCGVVYFDPWPLAFPLIAVLHPAMISQFTTSPSLPKFYWMRETEFHRFSGGVDLLTSEGSAWKDQRVIYNPGFSTRNIASMAPWFLEEVLVYKERLLKAADLQMTIKLEEFSLDLALDVIARATFNIRTRAQEQKTSDWVDALRAQIKLIYFDLDLKKQLSPTLLYRHWKYNHVVKKAITPLIEDAYANSTSLEGPQTIIGLAVKPFVDKGASIPPDFVDKIVKNIKMFLFAGHETTGTTISTAYYLLSRNPDKLAALRAEHDAIFGSDPAKAIEAIRADYTILNKLPYTAAVVKEALRMYPPVGGTIRESASPEFMLTNPDTGARFPTYGFMIHEAAVAIHWDPKYWHKPDKFIPERFMVRDENDPLYPRKNLWQPFSLGPRACIGQEMVQLEIRLTLALTVREIDIMADYPEDAPTFNGEKAYQVSIADSAPSARSKSGLPVKVKRRACI